MEKKWFNIILNVVIFCASMVLVVIGQKKIGVPNLCMMFVGLAGLLFLLYRYNKKYQ